MKPSQRILQIVKETAQKRTEVGTGEPSPVYQETIPDWINAILVYLDKTLEETT